MADDATKQGALFEDAPQAEQLVTVSARCELRTRDGHRVVVVAGVPVLHYRLDDRMAEAHAIVSFVGQGWETQVETARGFGVATRTVGRMVQRFDEGGLAALGRPGGYPRGRPRLAAPRVRLIERMKTRGASNYEIAARLDVTEKAVRKVLRRLGWKERRPEQGVLPFAGGTDPSLSASSAPAAADAGATQDPAPAATAAPDAPPADPNLSAAVDEPSAPSLDRDPADRSFDRVCAAMGLLDDV